MRKEFCFLTLFVFCFCGVSPGEDWNPPDWRGMEGSTYARWEFEGNGNLPDEFIGDDRPHWGEDYTWIAEDPCTTFAVALGTVSGGVITENEIWIAISNFDSNDPEDPLGYNRKKRFRLQAVLQNYAMEWETETADVPWEDIEGGWIWVTSEMDDAVLIHEQTDLGNGWSYLLLEFEYRGYNPDYDTEWVPRNPAAETIALLSGPSRINLDQLIIDTICYEGEDIEAGTRVSNPVPVNKEKHVDPKANLSFQAPEEALCLFVDDPNDPNDAPPDPNLKGPFDYDVYFGREPNVPTMTQLADGFTPTNCDDVMVFDPCDDGDLNLATTYYWRVDINDANGGGDPCFYEGPYFSFTTWGLADNIAPADDALDVPVYGTRLMWAGDVWGDTFDVYFSTDVEEVNNNNALVGDDQEPNTYDPGTLVLDTEYFWRIDEVNGIELKGDIWSFSTDISMVVDNMDSYNNSFNDIYDTWLDRWTITTASEVFLETAVVVDGNSMALAYNNTLVVGNIYGSWTEASISDLVVGSDWEEIGGKALQLSFYGQTTNTAGVDDKMYVVLKDASANVGISYYPDVNDVKIEEWQEWNIDLEDFNSQGVDLTNVSNIAIGFGTYGGSSTAGIGVGTVYIDNILLWATRCVREFAPGDVDGDCLVDIWDLEDMSFDWLESDYNVVSTEPSRDGLLVEYLFTVGLEDTANSYDGIDGDGSGTAVKVANGYLSIEQLVGDIYHVEVPLGADNPFDGSSDFSISMKFRTDTGGILISSADPCEPNDPNNHSMALFLLDEAGEDWFYKAARYDNFFVSDAGYENEESDWQISDWHHIAVTYDSDGGICEEDSYDPNACPPGEITGLITIYVDGIPFEDWEGNFDPNIPDIADDEVHIGDSLNVEFPAGEYESGEAGFTGDIDEVRIYTEALTHGNVLWLAEIGDTYFTLDSEANLYPKVGLYGFDPNNVDIVDFKDFSVIAENWLAEERLWP